MKKLPLFITAVIFTLGMLFTTGICLTAGCAEKKFPRKKKQEVDKTPAEISPLSKLPDDKRLHPVAPEVPETKMTRTEEEKQQPDVPTDRESLKLACEKSCKRLIDCFGAKPDVPEGLKDKSKCMDGCDKAWEADAEKWKADYKRIAPYLDRSCGDFIKAVTGQPMDPSQNLVDASKECKKGCAKFTDCMGKDKESSQKQKDELICIQRCEKDRINNLKEWQARFQNLEPLLNLDCDAFQKALKDTK